MLPIRGRKRWITVAPAVGQCGVDAVAKVLRGVDQRAIQIEYQQFQPFNGQWTKNTNHVFSLTGGPASLARTVASGECRNLHFRGCNSP